VGNVSRGSIALLCYRPPRKSFRSSILCASSLFTSRCNPCDLVFPDVCSECRALAKHARRKLCIFLVLQMAAKKAPASTRDTVPLGNKALGADIARPNCHPLGMQGQVWRSVSFRPPRRRYFRAHAFHGHLVLDSGISLYGRSPVFARRASDCPGTARARVGCGPCALRPTKAAASHRHPPFVARGAASVPASPRDR
jgi:hypothetical protein